MTKVNIIPLGDRVLVEPKMTDEKTPAGIIIPDGAAEKQNVGTVIAVGTLEEIKNVKVG
ncbi:MAG: co-chaperone GroES, partial [Candidatus Pacebacteria bacterium]|nr:co-chaperone GroES [Candidatus Paceibacterota bacterium]